VLKLILMHSTEVGLVLFVASFVFITWYALTRSRKELDGWSNLPLRTSHDPSEGELPHRSDIHD
jgi:hypothetical protein